MKKKPTKKGLGKKLEKLVADYVKLRDKYTCQYCRKRVEGSNCHASHVIPKSRGNQYRFDPMNLKVLCYHHHINWWHKEPIAAGEWFKVTFPDRYSYLYTEAGQLVKFTVQDYQQMIEDIKQKINELEST